MSQMLGIASVLESSGKPRDAQGKQSRREDRGGTTFLTTDPTVLPPPPPLLIVTAENPPPLPLRTPQSRCPESSFSVDPASPTDVKSSFRL